LRNPISKFDGTLTSTLALKPGQAEHPGGETLGTLVGWSDKRVDPERSSTAVLDYNQLLEEKSLIVQLKLFKAAKL
jgi:hypothetical protein